MTTFSLILFHVLIFYIIGMLAAYGYIDLNNRFESRRDKTNQRMGSIYPDYFIKKKNMFKSFYFFVEIFLLKKY